MLRKDNFGNLLIILSLLLIILVVQIWNMFGANITNFDSVIQLIVVVLIIVMSSKFKHKGIFAIKNIVVILVMLTNLVLTIILVPPGLIYGYDFVLFTIICLLYLSALIFAIYDLQRILRRI